MQQKILLVGEPRICPQVAYVMDWQDFEQVEQLTDATKYRDYKIVVCAFKKKSKRLVKIKDKTLNIIYLDDICRELDKDYSFANLVATIEPKTPWKIVVKHLISLPGVMWLLNGWRQRLIFRSPFWLKRINHQFIKPSELLLHVLYAKPTNISCDRLEHNCSVGESGYLWGCCPDAVKVPFGKITAEQQDIYNSYQARIIKLSSLNHSYCFCDMRRCLHAHYAAATDYNLKPLPTNQSPLSLEVAMDRSCNLRCPSCRRSHYTADEAEQNRLAVITSYLQQYGWLDQAESVTWAGLGEVFYSRSYRALLTSDYKAKTIYILSNGTLFNQANWDLIKDKFETINVEISLDAATADTYRRLRGWDFDQLLKNLTMLGNLRAANKIKFLQFIFVVQKDNYREMVDFVRLSKQFNVDRVQFLRLNNWGTFTRREYKQKSLLRKNRYLTRELYAVLQDPIFKDSIVDLTAFQPYLAASSKRYGKCNAASGRG